jgi:hypothetical protein
VTFHFDFGDVPTWLAVAAAAGAAFIALRALKAQNLETARQVAVLERQQADQVDARSNPVASSAAPVPGRIIAVPIFYRGITIVNGSRRPIRDITARIDPADGDGLMPPAKARVERGGAKWGNSTVLALIRAGHEGSFYFTVTFTEHPQATILLRFTDDAGLHWQIDHNLHLQKLELRDW